MVEFTGSVHLSFDPGALIEVTTEYRIRLLISRPVITTLSIKDAFVEVPSVLRSISVCHTSITMTFVETPLTSVFFSLSVDLNSMAMSHRLNFCAVFFWKWGSILDDLGWGVRIYSFALVLIERELWFGSFFRLFVHNVNHLSIIDRTVRHF